jgi:hypothetical protein
MGLLDFLSPALTAGTQGAAAWQQGQAAGRKERELETMKMLEMLRQKRVDELDAQMKRAQIGNYESLARERGLPKVATPLTHLGENDLIPNPDFGKTPDAPRFIRAGGPKPTLPSVPVRGTPQYLKMLDEEEGIRARHRPPPRSPVGPRLPASMVSQLGAYDAIEGMATEVKERLEKAVRENVDVTGRAGGIIKTPTWVKNAIGKGGVIGKDVRGLIGNLYATLAKERGGTALSENELRLLESYMPNENEPEGTAIVKANRLVREIKRLKTAKLAALQKYGGFIFDDATDPRETSADNPYLRPPDGE